MPTAELFALRESVKRQLIADGYRDVERLDRCPKQKLLELGYSEWAIVQARKALSEHRRFVEAIEAIFASEGLQPKQVKDFWPFDLLRLPFTCAQLGYILRWQRDVAGRYGDKDLFCMAGGRIYYCTECPYRNEQSNFCGICYRKLRDEAARQKRGKV